MWGRPTAHKLCKRGLSEKIKKRGKTVCEKLTSKNPKAIITLMELEIVSSREHRRFTSHYPFFLCLVLPSFSLSCGFFGAASAGPLDLQY